jgi:broad specificity phosphatase PhoE
MNTFYIVRHGETENNRAKRFSGWIDTPLTLSGLMDTESLISKLKNVHIHAPYSSDMGWAFVTAYVIAQKLHFTESITCLAGLREVNYGDVVNMLAEAAYELFPQLDQDAHYTPPNVESLKHMQKWVLHTIDSIKQQYTNTSIVLVCHSGVMVALQAERHS